MASGSATSETSPKELMDDDACDDLHLACGCRPAITHCGTYLPGMQGVDLISVTDNICAGCLKVWHTTGCGACSCGPGAICNACIKSATDRS